MDHTTGPFNRPARPLREAHAHVAQHGRAMEMVPLGACSGAEECLQRLGAAAASRPWLRLLQSTASLNHMWHIGRDCDQKVLSGIHPLQFF